MFNPFKKRETPDLSTEFNDSYRNLVKHYRSLMSNIANQLEPILIPVEDAIDIKIEVHEYLKRQEATARDQYVFARSQGIPKQEAEIRCLDPVRRLVKATLDNTVQNHEILRFVKSGYQLINSFQDKDKISEATIKFPEFIEFTKRLRVVKEDASEININPNKTSTIIKPNERRLQEGFLRSPLETAIEITSECQLSCSHCYVAFSSKPNTNELKDKEIFSIIDQFKDLGVFAIFVGGGEPTIHSSFFEICRYILNNDINVVVSTNGIGLDKKTADSFSELGNYVGVQISLEGSNKTINDRIRGPGSFEKAIKGLKNLQSVGLNPTIGTTITNVNYNSIENMVQLAENLTVPHIHFMCLMPSGRGDKLYGRLQLSKEQKIWLTRKMRELKEKYKNIIGLDCANFFQQPPTKNFDPNKSYDSVDKIYAGCEASRVRATITSTGDVIGCEIIRDLISGNIREKKFLDIWENSKTFKKIRSRNFKNLEGKCNSCQYLIACVGDCPSYSIHNGKSFFIGGEECPHEPETGAYHILD